MLASRCRLWSGEFGDRGGGDKVGRRLGLVEDRGAPVLVGNLNGRWCSELAAIGLCVDGPDRGWGLRGREVGLCDVAWSRGEM